jgi:hypothetical protein
MAAMCGAAEYSHLYRVAPTISLVQITLTAVTACSSGNVDIADGAYNVVRLPLARGRDARDQCTRVLRPSRPATSR